MAVLLLFDVSWQIFVPIFFEKHFIVLVINIPRRTIEIADNRSDFDTFGRYVKEGVDAVEKFVCVLLHITS